MASLTKSPEPTPARVSVVGRNVSAALMTLELSQRLAAGSQLSWHFTQQDQKWLASQESASHWVFHPSALSQSKNPSISAKSLSLSQVPFYFEGHKRFNVNAANPIPRAPVLEPILKRIVAIALWNDFTPDLWKRAKGGFSIPDSSWTKKNSWSQDVWKNWKPILYHRPTMLFSLSQNLREEGVQVSKNEKGVLGIQVGTFRHEHRAVMNVPFEAEAFDKMLWMSQGQLLQREHSATKKLIQKS
jgi:hypothetical protein